MSASTAIRSLTRAPSAAAGSEISAEVRALSDTTLKRSPSDHLNARRPADHEGHHEGDLRAAAPARRLGRLAAHRQQAQQLRTTIFNYARREDTHAIASNPVEATIKRREPPPAVLDFYEPEEIEALAQAAADGRHRGPRPKDLEPEEIAWRAREDAQDAELFRLAAYTGLRLGELLALRWQDVDLQTRRMIVHRAVSAGVEGPTKSWQARFIPPADPAADALMRLRAREDYTERDDYVFCSRLGRRLDSSAVRRRYKRARDAAGLRALRFHALRHGAGSLVARHADARFVQDFLGHSRITTTERYMHAKARPEDVERVNLAFGVASGERPASR